MKRKWVGGKEDNGKFDIEFQISGRNWNCIREGLEISIFFFPLCLISRVARNVSNGLIKNSVSGGR